MTEPAVILLPPEYFVLGDWIIANACAAHQIVSRALFHQLAEDLAVQRQKRRVQDELGPHPRKRKKRK